MRSWLAIALFAAGCAHASPGYRIPPKAHLALKEATLHLANGSGSLVRTPKGKTVILTNWHVCLSGRIYGNMQGADEEGNSYRGPIIKESASKDLCAIEVAPGDAAPLRVAGTTDYHTLVTRGYPAGVLVESVGTGQGYSRWCYDFSLAQVGKCVGLGTPLKDTRGIYSICKVCWKSYLTTLYAVPGSSGSPVTNVNGELVGVVSSQSLENEQHSGGIVSLEQVQEFLKDL